MNIFNYAHNRKQSERFDQQNEFDLKEKIDIGKHKNFFETMILYFTFYYAIKAYLAVAWNSSGTDISRQISRVEGYNTVDYTRNKHENKKTNIRSKC